MNDGAKRLLRPSFTEELEAGVLCPFCERVAAGKLLAENALAVALADGFPLSLGHTLVVPRRHQADYFALSAEEQQAIWSLVGAMREVIQEREAPDGYTLGVNVGVAGGQTVAHAHVHLIPRRAGDVADPRGGVRWVLPERAAYWKR